MSRGSAMKLATFAWKIKGFLNKPELKFYNEYTRARYWRKKGVRIGNDVRILTDMFLTESYLIRIGNHVTIAGGATFLNHDGAVWLSAISIPICSVSEPSLSRTTVLLARMS